jgi:methionine-rich copper-binding protein CopC
VIESLPDHVSLTFSDDLTPPLPAEQQQGGESTTQIRVYDETCTDAALLIADPGHADTRDCTDYADGEAAVDGPTVSVAVNNVGAPAGVYTVVWQVVYGDGHADSQMFTFTAESAVAAEQSPSATPSATEPRRPHRRRRLAHRRTTRPTATRQTRERRPPGSSRTTAPSPRPPSWRSSAVPSCSCSSCSSS